MLKLRKEDGASAVEFALVAPLLFMVLFGIIAFGIAFLQLQTARGAVREGARYAAVAEAGTKVHKPANEVANRVAEASSGLISAGDVNTSGASCNGGAGTQAVVSYNTAQANGGQGIQVLIPFVPSINLDQTVTAQFMCEG